MRELFRKTLHSKASISYMFWVPQEEQGVEGQAAEPLWEGFPWTGVAATRVQRRCTVTVNCQPFLLACKMLRQGMRACMR